MIQDLGTIRPGTTVYIPFHTFDSNDPSASVTMTGLATTDIEIYKDGGTTQRASDNGYALLDTDGIDFDGITGIHGISINLADNSTAGFYAAGSQYWVVISSITVDAATINFILATFRIGYEDAVINTTIATLASQTSFTLTSGPAEDDALNGCVVCIHDVASAVQLGYAVISDYTGSTKTVTLAAGTTFTAAAADNISIFPPSNAHTISNNAITAAVIATDAIDADAIADNAINAASIASDAITAAKIAADAITAAKLAADVATEIQSGLATQASVNTIDDFLDTEVAAILAAVDTEIAAIKTVTDQFAFGTPNRVNAQVFGMENDVVTAGAIADGAIDAGAFAADAITATAMGVGAITADAFAVDAIDAPAIASNAFTASKFDSDVAAEIATQVTAQILTDLGLFVASGTIGATGNTTTALHLAGLAYADDAINSLMLVIQDVSTGLRYSRWIEDFANTGDLATVATLPFTPQASTDLYWILPIRSDVTGGSGLDAAGVRAALGMASANLDTQLGDLPTNAELATALGTADDAVLAAIAALNNLSQANIRTALGMASANLDTQLDALPTNAELATALGTADDAVLAAIAALNNLSQANIRTAVGLASANLDTQLAAVATAANLATLSGYVDTEVAAILAAVDTEIAAIKAKTDNLPTDPADASDIAASFASIASTLSTLAAYVDTEVAAIKAKTDSLTFTVANVLDANIQRVNDVAVAGTGASGDEWGPA